MVLFRDHPGRRYQHEVAHASYLGQVLHRSGEDVRLADPGRTVHHALEGPRLAVHVVVLGDLEGDALHRLLVRFAQAQAASDRFKHVQVYVQHAHRAAPTPVAASVVLLSACTTTEGQSSPSERGPARR